MSGQAGERGPTCSWCDSARRAERKPWLVGRPCDICDGRQFDYIGRPCRHCSSGGHSGSSAP